MIQKQLFGLLLIITTLVSAIILPQTDTVLVQKLDSLIN
jgi:hypothetical protein